jgi:large subunit ribosomal protein L6
MSRIGRRPIEIPSGVELTIGEQNYVEVKGPKGTLSERFHTDLTITKENGIVTVVRPDDEREHRAVHGLTRTLINNMVVGVTDGFKKNLEIQGVGYRAAIDGQTLVLNVGYSHPVRMTPVEGVMFAVDGPNKIIVSGSSKQQVGEEAARIRRTRPPEPYKGKGIRYEGEYVRRKAGKTGKAK